MLCLDVGESVPLSVELGENQPNHTVPNLPEVLLFLLRFWPEHHLLGGFPVLFGSLLTRHPALPSSGECRTLILGWDGWVIRATWRVSDISSNKTWKLRHRYIFSTDVHGGFRCLETNTTDPILLGDKQAFPGSKANILWEDNWTLSSTAIHMSAHCLSN